MGGWVGGQAEYVMVPYADFNLLKFPDKAQAMEKIRDLTCLSDILPTGYYGAVSAGVGPGTTVYVAGAGPVGLACAAACQLLGAPVKVESLIPCVVSFSGLHCGKGNRLQLDSVELDCCSDRFSAN